VPLEAEYAEDTARIVNLNAQYASILLFPVSRMYISILCVCSVHEMARCGRHWSVAEMTNPLWFVFFIVTMVTKHAHGSQKNVTHKYGVRIRTRFFFFFFFFFFFLLEIL
jgi:hypothetical protein